MPDETALPAQIQQRKIKTMKSKKQLEIEGTDPRWLSPAQIGWLSRAQIGWLSRAQIGGLSPAQIGGLSPAQIGGLSPAQQEWLGLKNVPTLENPYTKILAAIISSPARFDHCLWGWTCVLAPGGREFEQAIGSTGTAAELILRKSRPDAPLPYFMASNEAAMAFIEARAAEEK